jgi:hypothetical protein
VCVCLSLSLSLCASLSISLYFFLSVCFCLSVCVYLLRYFFFASIYLLFSLSFLQINAWAHSASLASTHQTSQQYISLA